MPLKIYFIEADNLHLKNMIQNLSKKTVIKLSDPSHY